MSCSCNVTILSEMTGTDDCSPTTTVRVGNYLHCVVPSDKDDNSSILGIVYEELKEIEPYVATDTLCFRLMNPALFYQTLLLVL